MRGLLTSPLPAPPHLPSVLQKPCPRALSPWWSSGGWGQPTKPDRWAPSGPMSSSGKVKNIPGALADMRGKLSLELRAGTASWFGSFLLVQQAFVVGTPEGRQGRGRRGEEGVSQPVPGLWPPALPPGSWRGGR